MWTATAGPTSSTAPARGCSSSTRRKASSWRRTAASPTNRVAWGRCSATSTATATPTCAAWGDIDNDGRPDLVVGCLRGPNRLFRNKGDGTFEDMSEAVGLTQRVCNTQAVCLVDLNGDGVLDMVFNNEGQESCVLLGNPDWGRKMTPLVVSIKGKEGVLGSQVRVLDKEGKLQGSHTVSGGDGRGGQAAPTARFALKPGTYKVEVLFSTGVKRMREVVVASSPVRDVIDDNTPQAQ